VLKGEEWIRDMIFPARLFLKSVGISTVRYADLPSSREPLLLSKLEQYQVRDFLMQQDQEIEPSLMLDRLPVGKTQQATWLESQQEQRGLKERLLALGKELTPITQQSWHFSPELLIHINVPKVAQSSYWLSMQSSSASEKRQAQVWLEYLLWLAYLADDLHTPALERIVIFSNKTLKFSGLNSSKAREYLQFWFKAWEIGQKQPLVLPAELLMKKDWQWTENEQGQMMIVEMQELLKAWNNSYESAKPLASDEACVLHQDWQFILQDQDPDLALQSCCHDFAHALYAPIHQHLDWV
jgi:exodeoxyribonuclease V gamma subunit